MCDVISVVAKFKLVLLGFKLGVRLPCYRDTRCCSGLNPCHVFVVINAVAEFMVDVAGVEPLPHM